MKPWHRVLAGFLEATILIGGIMFGLTVFADAPGPRSATTWAGIIAIWFVTGVAFSWLVNARGTAFRAQRGRRITRDAQRRENRHE